MTRIKFVNLLSNELIVKFSKIGPLWKLSAAKFLLTKNKQPLTIVTAADTSHYESLINLLKSIKLIEPNLNVSIWDLGFTDIELGNLKSNFPEFKINRFEFENYPSHFNLRINAGEYAWKPAIINQEFDRTSGLLLWLDAGDLIFKELFWIRKFIAATGFYSPYSAGYVSQWTHPAMLQKFKISGTTRYKRNLNGAIVGFDTNNAAAKKLILAWFQCAMDKDCIAPIGSGRGNHRQDQAALTCLAYANNIAPRGMFAVNRKYLGIKQHQDI